MIERRKRKRGLGFGKGDVRSKHTYFFAQPRLVSRTTETLSRSPIKNVGSGRLWNWRMWQSDASNSVQKRETPRTTKIDVFVAELHSMEREMNLRRDILKTRNPDGKTYATAAAAVDTGRGCARNSDRSKTQTVVKQPSVQASNSVTIHAETTRNSDDCELERGWIGGKVGCSVVLEQVFIFFEPSVFSKTP